MSAPGQHRDNQAEREPGERAADRQHLPHNDCGDTLPGTILEHIPTFGNYSRYSFTHFFRHAQAAALIEFATRPSY